MQVSGGGDRVVRVWSADTCTHFHTFRGHRGTVTVMVSLVTTPTVYGRQSFVYVHYQSVGVKLVSCVAATKQ